MQGYQKYQQYQKKSSNFKGNKALKYIIWAAIAVVVFLILKSLFATSAEVTVTYPGDLNPELNMEATSAEPEPTDTAESQTNDNSNGNTNVNSNENINSNNNTNVNVDSSEADGFDIASCDRVYSRGAAAEKKVSLTFNVGTTKEGEIDKLLAALSEKNAAADFFARGDVAEENNELIKKISEAGFSVYNLSYDHPKFNSLSETAIAEQLADAESQISQITGQTTKPFFRPPYGEANESVVAAVATQGYCPVTWTVDALDWSSDYTAETSKERVLSNISNGAIILMQASNSTTATIVPQIIEELGESGYEFVKIIDLL